MQTFTHGQLVAHQYDPRSRAYLDSAVHAQGADLDVMSQQAGQQHYLRALDVGCGGGHVTFRLAPQVQDMVACDLSVSMLETVKQEALLRGLSNVSVHQGAAASLPFATASFDLVATRYSVHHWPDAQAGLREMARVLRPGGMAFFSDVMGSLVPLQDTWLQSIELLRDPSHVKNLSLLEWERLIRNNGFSIEGVERYRLRLDFASWVARMHTPGVQVAAIRALQACASQEIRDYLEIEADGSFALDTALVIARRL